MHARLRRHKARLIALCCALTFGAHNFAMRTAAIGDDGGQNANNSRHSYHVVHGWPQLPEGTLLGQVSGIGADSRGNVFVFRRADRVLPGPPINPQPIEPAAVMLFDGATGKLLASWGQRAFVMPHCLTVDGQDNVWLTDIALHQVFKFSHEGKPLLSVGVRGVPGDDRAHFNKPTDVAVAGDGSFYVSDGYGNNRVVKFSPDGRFQFEWGQKGSGPGQFDLPHSIALDSKGRIYVADRSNARLQVFDAKGAFIAEWKGTQLGRPWAVRAGADGYIYVVDGGDLHSQFQERARVLKLARDGSVVDSLGSFGNYDGQFVWPHAVAVANDGAVYVGDVATGMRAQKFVHE